MGRRWVHLGGVGAGLGVALIAWTAASAKWSTRMPVAAPFVVSSAWVDETDQLRRNETLTHLFARHNIAGGELQQLIEAAQQNGLNPRRIRPNQQFALRYVVGRDTPDRVRFRINSDAFLQLDRGADGAWESTLDEVQWTIVRERAIGSITSSLNNSIHETIPDSTLSRAERQEFITNVADDVFGWVIDFPRDNRPGDRFYLLYERLVSSEGDARFGRLLAASIETGGEAQTAYVMSGEGNRNEFYDAEGRSLQRAFLRSPVRLFSRISSRFGNRYHPVLQRYRAHLGTDFAAYSGEPIQATADGVVRRAGRWGGYGNIVTIRHPSPRGVPGVFETRYAHMSRVAPGIRAGVRVREGQTIGYVGMTGLATGPHVHYEFLKNGRHVDFYREDLGDGEPISDELRPALEEVRDAFDRILFAGLQRSPAIAANN